LQTTDCVFDFCANPDPAIAYFRTHIFPHLAGFALSFDAVKNFAFPLISQIGVNYHHSALSEKADSHFAVKAGDRMPYFRFENKSIYDVLRQPKFHWITFTNEQKDISATLDEIENFYPDLIDFQTVSLTPKITDIFGVDEPFYVLLRPDNYIAIITQKISLSNMREYFNRIGCGG